MNGKEKCEQLKEIRKRIADANGIPYKTKSCTHEDDCLGTCPACEAEVNYLERELEKKRKRGEKVIINGIAEDIFQKAMQSDDSSYDYFDDEPVQGNLRDIDRMGDYPDEYPDEGEDIWPLDPLPLETSDIEEYLNDIIDYMDSTADFAGLALDNYYVRCSTTGDDTIITLLGEISFSKNNYKLIEEHIIKGVIYDQNGRIEKEAIYPIRYPFSGFDIFHLKWTGGSLESWMEKRKIRLFIV